MSLRKRAGKFLAYLALKGIVLLTQYLPRIAGYAIWISFFALMFRLWGTRRRIAVEQLQKAFPGEPAERLTALARESYINQGRFFTEFFRIPLLTAGEFENFIRFEGMEDLQAAYAKGKGVILVWAHFDHFEGVNGALAKRGYPVCSVIREVDNPAVDRLMDSVRESTGQKVIKREGAFGEIVKSLREGAIVSIAADQNTIFNNIYVKFFGDWASTFKSPAVIHLRTGAPIILFYTFRNEGGAHTAHFLPELRTEKTGDIRRDVFFVTQQIADLQADFIRRRPDLWLWMHRRWKTRPDEEEERRAAALHAEYERAKGG